MLKIGIQIWSGFALAPGAGASELPITGLITLLMAGTPVWTEGTVSIMILGLIVSALGIRLNALSMENGKASRTATIPQSRTLTHLGAFFKTNLRISTARTNQLAEMLMLMIFKKSSFIANLLS